MVALVSKCLFACLICLGLTGVHSTNTTETMSTSITSAPISAASTSLTSTIAPTATAETATATATATVTATTAITPTTTQKLRICFAHNCSSNSSTCLSNDLSLVGNKTCPQNYCKITRITSGSIVNITADCSSVTCSYSKESVSSQTKENSCCGDDLCNKESILSAAPAFLTGHLSLIISFGIGLLSVI